MQRKASINRSLFSGLKVGFGLVRAMQSNGPQFKFRWMSYITLVDVRWQHAMKLLRDLVILFNQYGFL